MQGEKTEDQRWAMYDGVIEILRTGDEEQFLRLQREYPAFPHERDPVLDRQWIVNAVHVEAIEAVTWMIGQGVDLSHCDGEGLTPLSEAFGCNTEAIRYFLLRLLLAHGARPDQITSNFFTVAHWAAARNDVGALRILNQYGDDLCVATDDYRPRTPADVAAFHKSREAHDYLVHVCQGVANKVPGP